jgi:hypothetical protein
VNEIVVDYRRYRSLQFTRRQALDFALMRARAKKHLATPTARPAPSIDKGSLPRQ